MKARCLAEGGAYQEFRSLRKPLTACLCMAVPLRAEGPRFSPRSLLGRPTSDGPLTERHHRAQASVVEISHPMRLEKLQAYGKHGDETVDETLSPPLALALNSPIPRP